MFPPSKGDTCCTLNNGGVVGETDILFDAKKEDFLYNIEPEKHHPWVPRNWNRLARIDASARIFQHICHPAVPGGKRVVSFVFS